jgi:hypothetical protein
MSEQFILFFSLFLWLATFNTHMSTWRSRVRPRHRRVGSHARDLGLLILLQALLVHVTVLCAPFVVVVVFVIMGK